MHLLVPCMAAILNIAIYGHSGGRPSRRPSKIEIVWYKLHLCQIWCFWVILNQISLRTLTSRPFLCSEPSPAPKIFSSIELLHFVADIIYFTQSSGRHCCMIPFTHKLPPKMMKMNTCIQYKCTCCSIRLQIYRAS